MAMTHLPSPGLGTSGNDDPEECAATVARALEIGYRHVDTAQMYDNEAAVGKGLERATAEAGPGGGIPREEVFVASKVHPDTLAHEDVLATTDRSRERLGVETIDLMYVHWPTSAYEPEATLSAFDELRNAGKIRHVGVSNFTPELLDEAREILAAPIVAHQVEMHPYLPQAELVGYAQRHGHALVAYSPLAQGEVVEDPVLQEIAEDYDATPAQVTLAWHQAKETVVPIPKGRGHHVDENYAAVDIDLDEDDLERIDAIDREKRIVDPDAAAWNR
ncbi:MAG: 2,5-diketo-D-gluconate reductase B [Halobacteriales archaeon]|jgi:2,5-diketo-D-gluconate reductase B